MKILGLTGGSGTGKSTVAQLLTARGAGVVDADALYHALCVSCTPMLRELSAAFGDVLCADGALNRGALAPIVFSDPAKLEQLNTLVYPYIRDASFAAFDRLAAEGCTLALFDAPTLIESGLHRLCRDEVTGAGVLGILAPVEVRIGRIIARDGLTEQAARARVGAQPPDSFYFQRCDYLIRNDNGLAELRPLVSRFWDALSRLPLAPEPRGLLFAQQDSPA